MVGYIVTNLERQELATPLITFPQPHFNKRMNLTQLKYFVVQDINYCAQLHAFIRLV